MKNKGKVQLVIALLILGIIIISSILAPLLAPYDPNLTNMASRLQGPSIKHLLGTDALGRDMLSRVLYGGRASMLLALTATTLSMLVGMVLGVIAGYYGGVIDWCITILANIFQGIPGTCFMIAIAGVLGPSIQSLLLALVLTSWAGFSLIVRTEVLCLREEPYIEGMRCLGSSDLRLIIYHIIPNMINNTIILFTTRVGRCVLSIASLSFLGLGVQPPTPDWSVMINDARMHYRSAPHLIIVPGLCIFFLLLSINMLGDALRDRLDVKNQEVLEC
ncbi:ABC transporter permease [Clostridium sp. MSJ-4]|uniref:ABC transporter permease n=1 Tax=Clostridium simiarum TaxID=2841506 RepID=A0ABS6F6N2_9CLOT|nr:ABC transporter permease [Clostridium simiarum]MBU5593182.1 ABC transporter permease [Clostridium simiarum]